MSSVESKAYPKFMETTKLKKGKKIKAYSRTFKLVSVNNRQWSRKVDSDKSDTKIIPSVQVKTTSRDAVGQLAKRAAGKLFSIYCHHTNKKADCTASIVIREITKCVPSDKQKTYKYTAGRKLIRKEDRGPFGQEYINMVHSQKPHSIKKRGSNSRLNRSMKKSNSKKSNNKSSGSNKSSRSSKGSTK